jgi:tRNA threonylcarbamoyladenosine biosynthesis protein TsaE
VPESEAHTTLLVTHSPENTQQFGEQLGRLIQPGDIICLSGELGAGKTTLAAGIGRGWRALEAVNSPTFVLVNAYSRAGGERLYHIDAYRLRDSADAGSIALYDLLNETGSAILIEWPERLVDALPPERLWLNLRWQGEQARSIEISAAGARHIALAQAARVGYDSGN